MHGHGQGGHHHGIDMAHPVLALNMTIVSIAVKEGYGGHPSCKYCSSDLAYLYLSSEIKLFPFFSLAMNLSQHYIEDVICFPGALC